MRSLRSSTFVWGFASQAASSLTNFGLALLAGRILGSAGVGIVAVGFAAYLVALGIQRALITDPLVAASSALDSDDRVGISRAALTATLALSIGAAVLVGVAGGILGGTAGRGLLLISPWLAPSLIQDFWRAALFRDLRGRAGAANDVTWLIVMALTAPLVFTIRSEWTVVGNWGLGAFAAMVVGAFQTRAIPARLRPALNWWRYQAWPLGRWLSASGLVYILGSQALVFLYAALLGVGELGGLRAAESVFAPLSVIGPALGLPGLPYLARKVATAPDRAPLAAAALGAVGGVLSGLYLAVMALSGGRALTLVFGGSFLVFRRLVWPFGIGQLLTSLTIGFSLLLRAQRRGGAIFVSQFVATASRLGFGVGLALPYGVVGAAWGMMLGTVSGGLTMAVLVLGRRRSNSLGTSPRPGVEDRGGAEARPPLLLPPSE